MSGIGEKPVDILEAFDRDGCHLGSAHCLCLTRRWVVTVYVPDEQAARRMLEQHGADQILERRGSQ